MKTRKTKEYELFSIDFTQQWTQFLAPKKYNWLDFDFINLYFEIDRVFGSAEIEIKLLGFGFRIYWVYNPKQSKKKAKEYEKKYSNFLGEKDKKGECK